MNRSYWSKGALNVTAISIILAFVMLSGALAQYDYEALRGMDDEGAAFVLMPDQTSLAGLWNLSLTDQEIQYLNLTLSEVNKSLFGAGIWSLNNNSRQVTAVGWNEGDYYLLYVVASDGDEMIKIQLKEIGGLISGEYNSYDARGKISNGEVRGFRIITYIATTWGPFGVLPKEVPNAKNDYNNEKNRKGTDNSLNGSG